MKAAANALALALLERYGDTDGPTMSMDVSEARRFAAEFFEANVDLFTLPAPVVKAPVYTTGDIGRAVTAPAKAPSVPTCKNCGAPVNDHMRGCVNVTKA